MVLTAQGVCPSCRERGDVGTPCAERGCTRYGYHCIPAELIPADDGKGRLDPEVGLLLDRRYLLVRTLGEGGFGRVFIALQQPLGMRVALKILKKDKDPEGHEARMRLFRLEAQAMAQLQHPNIVKILDFGFFEGAAYLVMELLDGALTLKDELRNCARTNEHIDLHTTETILSGVLSALEKAHQRKIIHRDVKPENIMLQAEPGHPVLPRLLDFGLAKFVDADTQSSAILGTPSYMAPEQLTRSDPGPWTDLYALGVVAFELLTGRRPFVGEVGQIIADKRDPHFDVLSAIADLDIPTPIAAFLRKALAFETTARYQSTDAFRDAMRSAFQAVSPALATARSVPLSPPAPGPLAPPRASPPMPTPAPQMTPPVLLSRSAPSSTQAPSPQPSRAPVDDSNDLITVARLEDVLDATPPRRATTATIDAAPTPRKASSRKGLWFGLAGLGVTAAIVVATLSPSANTPSSTPSEASATDMAGAAARPGMDAVEPPPATPSLPPLAPELGDGDAEAKAMLDAPRWDDPTWLETHCKRSLARAAAAVQRFHSPFESAVCELDSEGRRTRCNGLAAFDQIHRELDTANGLAFTVGYANVTVPMRAAAQQCLADLTRFTMELGANTQIYNVLSELAVTYSRGALDPVSSRYLERALTDFRAMGIDRDEATRRRIRELQQTLTDAERRYIDNIARDGKTYRLDHPSHVAGLPEAVKSLLPKDAAGQPQVSLDPPTFELFMRHSPNAALREQFQKAAQTRAFPVNAGILTEVIGLRHEIALLRGLENAAELELRTTMLGSPSRAESFLSDVQTKNLTRAESDLASLRSEKRKVAGTTTLDPADYLFYTQRIRDRILGSPPASARDYLRIDKVVTGLLTHYGELFGVEWARLSDLPTWHPSVQVWEFHDPSTKAVLGRLYLDLVARDTKQVQVDLVPIQTGLSDGRLPVVAAFASLPDPADPAARLEHSELIALSRTLGGAHHLLLAVDTPYVGLGVSRIEGDFKTSLATFFEAFAWDPSVLARFATNDAGEPVPAELMTKLRAAADVGKGLALSRQIFFSAFALLLHTGDPKTLDLEAFSKATWERWSLLPRAPDEKLYAHFGQLMSVRSVYVAFVLQEAVAADLLAPYLSGGLSDPAVGARFRKVVLAPGASRPPIDLVEAFLGHSLDFRVFYASLVDPEDAPAQPARPKPKDAAPTAERTAEELYKEARAIHHADPAGALDLYEKAAAKGYPAAHKMIGSIKVQRGDSAGALSAYKRYLALVPGATDAAMVRDIIIRLGGTP